MQQNTLGKNILSIRERLGISQEQMAKDVLVTRQAVSQWENGTTIPSVDTLKIICEKYNVNMDAMMGLDEIKKLEAFERFQAKTNKFTAPYEEKYNTDRTAFLTAGFDNESETFFCVVSGYEDELLNILAAVYCKTLHEAKMLCANCHDFHPMYHNRNELTKKIEELLGKVSFPDLTLEEHPEYKEDVASQMKEDCDMMNAYFRSSTISCIYGIAYNPKSKGFVRHGYSRAIANLIGDPRYTPALIAYAISYVTALIRKKNQKENRNFHPSEKYFLNCIAVRSENIVGRRDKLFHAT